MSAVVLRRIMMVRCFGLAWTIALGLSAAATASPRDPFEMGGPIATGSASAYREGTQRARHRTAQSPSVSTRRGAPATGFVRRNRSTAFYRPGEHSIAQISPMILRGSRLSLEDDVPPQCAAKAGRRSSGCFRAKPLRFKDLADALLEAPSPATEKILKEIGIPAIKDVPPIAILRGGLSGADENFSAELR